jgi:hypothetical protein
LHDLFAISYQALSGHYVHCPLLSRLDSKIYHRAAVFQADLMARGK